MSCITPSSMGGGQAVSLSFSTGYGGSPGSSTIKFVGDSVSPPTLSVNSNMGVGVPGQIRTMTPVKYSIDQGVGSSTLSVTFQDTQPIAFSKVFIALNDPRVRIPGGQCVIPLGTLHHKPAGAPSATDESTVRAGPAPRIKEGNSWKILGEEMIMYHSAELAGAAGSYIGPSLRGIVASAGSVRNDTGSLLSIVQGIASEKGVELYCDSKGRIEVKPPPSGIAGGNGCGLTSLSTSGDITCTEAEGGYAIYKHEDQYRRKLKQRFKSIDLLGIPINSCDKNEVSLYKKEMGDQYKKELERALKMGWLDKNWQNWQGFMSYVYLKRMSDGADPGAEEDEVDVIKYSMHNKSKHGDNIPPKKSIKDCVKQTQIKLERIKEIKKNEVIDKVFDCVLPLKLNLEDIEDHIKVNFETNFKKGDVKGVVAKIPGDKLEYIALEGYKKLDCQGSDITESGSGPGVEANNEIVEGGQAEASSVLSEMATTIGKFWIMSGGMNGGSITERQHQLRTYEKNVGGNLHWYSGDLDVRETCFDSIYMALYGKKVAKGENHLSVSQFIKLAAKQKVMTKKGKPPAPPPGGKGQSGAAQAARNQQLARRCNNFEEKGIVIWERDFGDLALPEQEEVFKQLGAGVELHNDRYSNDVVRYLMEQVKTSVMANPCKGAAAPAEADCIDKLVDKYNPHADWQVNKRKSKNLNYTVLEDRSYFAARAKYPPCDSTYSASINSADLSGKVLWRSVDCFGKVLDYTTPFRSGGAVQAAMSRELAKMYKIKGEICYSSSTTSCGDSPASIPPSAESYSVNLGEDGSVTTTISVSGAASTAATGAIKNHAYKNSISPKNQTLMNNPPNLTDPFRKFR